MKAYEFLEQKDWCQACFARDGAGQPIDPSSTGVAAVCAVGAIKACYHDNDKARRLAKKVSNLLGIRGRRASLLGWTPLALYNDAHGRTKAEVVELLKKADV